jgi:hypothetical protein
MAKWIFAHNQDLRHPGEGINLKLTLNVRDTEKQRNWAICEASEHLETVRLTLEPLRLTLDPKRLHLELWRLTWKFFLKKQWIWGGFRVLTRSFRRRLSFSCFRVTPPDSSWGRTTLVQSELTSFQCEHKIHLNFKIVYQPLFITLLKFNCGNFSTLIYNVE